MVLKSPSDLPKTNGTIIPSKEESSAMNASSVKEYEVELLTRNEIILLLTI